MASSLVGGLINSGEPDSAIVVIDTDKAACQRASDQFGIRALNSFDEGLDEITSASESIPATIVIAVKPHVVADVCTSIASRVEEQTGASATQVLPLIVSVAAGVTTSSMQSHLPNKSAIVRCMPNTPALLGLGATALFANPHCDESQKGLASRLMDCAGMTRWVDDESELDAVTAVSGSGPAYFFYLIEHMIDAGVALGLEHEIARDLAIETAYGAASMARKRELSPQRLRENVTSKGGTTAAALAVFDQQQVPQIIRCAMQAARDRAVQLGNEG